MDGHDSGSVTRTPAWLVSDEERITDDVHHVWKPMPMGRSIYWVPTGQTGWEDASGTYEVFIEQRALESMNNHMWGAHPDDEPFGYLLGDLCEDRESRRRYVIIAEAVASSRMLLEAEHDLIGDEATRFLKRELRKRRRTLAGWYRRHAEGPVLPSEADVATHRARFAEPWQVAFLFVTDPEAPEGGCFRPTSDDAGGRGALPFHELARASSLMAHGVCRTRIDWQNVETEAKVVVDPVPRPDPPRPEPELVIESQAIGVTGVTPEPASEHAAPVAESVEEAIEEEVQGISDVDDGPSGHRFELVAEPESETRPELEPPLPPEIEPESETVIELEPEALVAETDEELEAADDEDLEAVDEAVAEADGDTALATESDDEIAAAEEDTAVAAEEELHAEPEAEVELEVEWELQAEEEIELEVADEALVEAEEHVELVAKSDEDLVTETEEYLAAADEALVAAEEDTPHVTESDEDLPAEADPPVVPVIQVRSVREMIAEEDVHAESEPEVDTEEDIETPAVDAEQEPELEVEAEPEPPPELVPLPQPEPVLRPQATPMYGEPAATPQPEVPIAAAVRAAPGKRESWLARANGDGTGRLNTAVDVVVSIVAVACILIGVRELAYGNPTTTDQPTVAAGLAQLVAPLRGADPARASVDENDPLAPLARDLRAGIARYRTIADMHAARRLGCSVLGDAYAEVDEGWTAYSIAAARSGRGSREDPPVVEEALVQDVQQVEANFSASGCDRP